MRILLLLAIVFSLPAYAIQPEPGSGYAYKAPVFGTQYMVVTANPHASDAAMNILEGGGNAIDAIIAAQMVLNVVEPQSSGIGGGGFLLYYDKKRGYLKSFDGRETAGSGAYGKMFLGDNGKPLSFLKAVQSGRSVGVPGLLKMLGTVHASNGELPWKELFQPAIDLADNGFEMSSRLHAVLGNYETLQHDKALKALYFNDGGSKKPVGSIIKNPDLAKVFSHIALYGADYMYKGALPKKIVAKVKGDNLPGYLTEKDFTRYSAVSRQPVCIKYRAYRVCGMGPPSSGGITVAQILGILAHFDLSEHKWYSPISLHLVAEAQRLAFADRNRYIADMDFVDVPVEALLEKDYLASRAKLINKFRAMQTVAPGDVSTLGLVSDVQPEGNSTTHISVIDTDGNVASYTSSIEHAFGSTLTVDGFLLNNQLTDFSFVPEKAGQVVANRVEAGKRPRSSMAPTIVFNEQGEVVLVVGSPGGARIIPYVVNFIVALLDYNISLKEVFKQGHVVAISDTVELEQLMGLEETGRLLQEMGHKITYKSLNSGIHAIVKQREVLVGVADPRREGLAIGR